ncbi:protein disulfide-isomerase [Plakobranchus ocellatus]|uniref:Protein disulfide-isomerase n=1 Tax=Plakobranchus ocellatus TaxID=259542 RepID=A0AAV4DKF9_9GAST|nr:protein disulfide-isomerase [Plakobranchus ocellatus]
MMFFILAAALIALGTADDVHVFTDSNFASEVAKHDVVLVEFYAPWCGHCKRLAPEYEKAAAILKKADPPVPLAKVDCTVETDTCSKYGVSGYPTLKIFKKGEFSKEYDGPREAGGIVKTMNKEAGPVSKKLESVKDARDFLEKETVGVIGFFESETSSLAKNFLKVADQLSDLRFAHTLNEKVKEEFKATKEGITLFRPKVLQSKFEEAQVEITATSSSALKSSLQSESLGLCAERTTSNAGTFEKPLVVAYFNVDYTKNPKGTNYWRNRVMKVGKKLRDEGEQIYFAISGLDEMGRELEECGISNTDGDKPFVCAWDSQNKKFKMTEEFSLDSFEQFVRDFLAGKVEPFVKSEPVPESNDEPVKVVVGKNFDEIVNDKEKDVLIEFYAPWCGHCKSLAPKYDDLAKKLENEDSLVIAKMDATANDVPSPYEVRGFPTIYYAPKGSKNSPKKYEGGREVKDFIKYLAKESTDGLKGYDRDGKKKKKDKKTEL